MSVQHTVFETYFSYWGYLLAVNVKIYLETSSLKRADNIRKLPGVNYVAKNWALAMMLKALPLVHFLSVYCCWKSKIMITSVRKTLKTLVWSAQNRLISSDHNIGRFLPIAFWRSLPWNFPRNWPIFHEFVAKNPAKFDFFPRDLPEALSFLYLDALKCCSLHSPGYYFSLQNFWKSKVNYKVNYQV